MRDPAADARRATVLQTIERHTRALADALDVVGLLNVQFAVKDGQVFVIEANPRASRTVPFVSKATGVPLAKVAARLMVGATLAELRAEGSACGRPPKATTSSIKEAVLPFNRFPDVDTLLGPEMRSTGEVMGIDRTFGMAFAKSQAGAGNTLPQQGHGVPLARRPRQGRPGSSRRAVSPSSASRSRPPKAPPRSSRRAGSRSRRSWPRSARTGAARMRST